MDHQGHNLARRTSIRLSHSALGKTRTPSLRIRSAAFCPLNYEGINSVDRIADFDGVGCGHRGVLTAPPVRTRPAIIVSDGPAVLGLDRHQTDYLFSSLSSRNTTMQIRRT